MADVGAVVLDDEAALSGAWFLAAPAAAAADAAVSAWCLTVARNFTHACMHALQVASIVYVHLVPVVAICLLWPHVGGACIVCLLIFPAGLITQAATMKRPRSVLLLCCWLSIFV
jgi:hypothetical protein